MKPESLPPVSEEELALRLPKQRLSLLAQFLMLTIAFLLVIVTAYFVWHFFAMRRINEGVARLRDAGFATTRNEVTAEYTVVEPNPGPLLVKAGGDIQATTGLTQGIPFFDDRATLPPQPGEDWTQLDVVRRFVENNLASVELVEQAAQMKHSPRYERRFDGPSGGRRPPVSVTHYKLSRLLSLAAFVHAHDGNLNQTVGVLSSGFCVAHSLSDEPTLLSQAVSSQCLEATLDACGKLLELDFHDEQLSELQTQIRQFDVCASLVKGMEGETVSAITYLSEPQWPGRTNRDDSAFFVESMLPMLEAAKAGEWAVTLEIAERSLEQAPRGPNVAFNLSRNALGMRALVVKKAISQAGLSVLDSALAAKRFQLKYGEAPPSLAQLVPEFLQCVPIDPFSKTGEPLIYVVNDKRILIYSRGYDGVDDGGDSKLRNYGTGRPSPYAIDIVGELTIE